MRMHSLGVGVLTLSFSSIALAQNTGVVFDMTGGRPMVVGTFNAGADARGAVWTSSTTAYVTNGQALLRVDLNDPTAPTVTSSASQFFQGPGGVPGNIFVNGAGTRAFIPGVVSDGVSSGVVYDISRTPMTQIAQIPTTGLMSAGAMFPGSRTAILPAGPNVVFLNTTADPIFSATSYPLTAGDSGAPVLGLAAVATNTATACVSLRDGGIQLLNIARFPPTMRGPPMRPAGCTTSPSIVFLPVSATLDRTIAITCPGAMSQVSLIDVEGGVPDLLSTTQLPAAFNNMRGGIAVHPSTGDLYISGNGVVGIISASGMWMNVTTTIPLNPPIVVERAGVALSPDATHLLIVGHQ